MPREACVNRRPRSALVGFLAATIVLSIAPMSAQAAPDKAEPEQPEYQYIDNRPGPAEKLAPNGATRLNRYGTPEKLTGKLAQALSTDPETAARQYLARNKATFGAANDLETVATTPIGKGAVVLLRQRFGGLPAAPDGLVAVAVKQGDVLQVTSSLSPQSAKPALLKATLKPADALKIALEDARIPAGRLSRQRTRQVAVPMRGAAPRTAYEVVILNNDGDHPLGYTTYVDARDGRILVRENLVNFAEDDPHWKVFPATPTGTGDSRQLWCATAATGCLRTVLDPATGKPWDVDPGTGTSTFTTRGNSADTVKFWDSTTPQIPATPSETREYTYPFTNQWSASKCDPASLASPQQADVDAATANLFAMHNRMHDWSYHLGFTEATWNLQKSNVTPYGKGSDAERGNAQQGAATQTTRNNANQATPPDGMTPVSNMYMWQPVAGSAYPPCVDGDYDMTVIGHEYTHAISNRMVAGPDSGITSSQGGAMGESWSDLMAMEYLFESGYTPRGNTPYVTGAFVTGDPATGIRNYDMSNSPLNYSDIGYDRVPAVHPDGEIWSATNFDVRRAFLARYGAGTRAQQESCANGLTPADQCPGNRRWAQLVFDSFLLAATGQVSMLDMRDNMLTADALRFDGANQDLLWNAFATRGMGAGASSGPSDADPSPSFASPYVDNIEVTFKPLGAGAAQPARLYIGDYESGAVPVADTDPATAIPDTVTLAPGTYRFLAAGKGLGHKRFTQSIFPGGNPVIGVLMTANLASSTAGATATGDGTGVASLIDDTEATTWTGTNGVTGKQVTVDLPADRAQLVSRVQVSGFGGGFSALRSFEVLTCDATRGADCATDAGYRVAFTSAADALPGGAYRPKQPQLIVRSFAVRPVNATHIRLRVLQNQCTGGPLYAGEQDNDPRSATDCATTAAARQVTAAEFEVFSS
jgi:extracellular elastinolytic metalloproteinase